MISCMETKNMNTSTMQEINLLNSSKSIVIQVFFRINGGNILCGLVSQVYAKIQIIWTHQ